MVPRSQLKQDSSVYLGLHLYKRRCRLPWLILSKCVPNFNPIDSLQGILRIRVWNFNKTAQHNQTFKINRLIFIPLKILNSSIGFKKERNRCNIYFREILSVLVQRHVACFHIFPYHFTNNLNGISITLKTWT